MIKEMDARLREQKKKIFSEEVSRGRNEKSMIASSSLSALLAPVPLLTDGPSSQKLEEFRLKNNELKLLLKEERERYDSLFEQYEDLMEKHSIIEKEYINLKYQHNRQLKELRKGLTLTLELEVERLIEQLTLHQQKDLLQGPTQFDLAARLRQISRVVASSKPAKLYSKRPIEEGSLRANSSHSTISDHHFTEEKEMVDASDLQLLSELEREPEIPEMNSEPFLAPEVASSAVGLQGLGREKQVFEDEYYGEIEDFEQFEEKVNRRRNYELMRRNSRSSTDIRRKKIFNSLSEVGCL